MRVWNCRPRVAIALTLSLVALALTVAVPEAARAAGGKGGGRGGKGGAKGAARPQAALKHAPQSAESRPLPTYKPKNALNRVIRYQIVEGAGKPDTVVVIRGDGVVRYKKGNEVRSLRLKKPQLKLLSQSIHKSGFHSLDSVYGDRALTPDPKSKTVMLKFAARSDSVQDFLDSEHPAPPAFRELTNHLDKLVQRLEKVPTSKIPFSGVGITVQTDRNVYQALPGQPAPTMWAALAINNSGDEPLRLEFSTAQKYDFSIRDAAGEEVYRWSKGREFEAQQSRLVVDKGGVHYVEQIPLAQASGASLAPGDYVLEWRLAGNLPSSGQVPFVIAEHAAPEAPAKEPAVAQPAKPAKNGGARKGGGRGGKRQNE